jgi:hypothetical protein
MPHYKTGRTRTLRFEGTVSSENAQASGMVPGVYPVKEFKLTIGVQGALIHVYTAIGDAPTLSGGSGRTQIEDPELGVTAVDVWNTKPVMPSAYDIDVTGEWYAEVEVEELLYTGDLAPEICQDIDGTLYPNFGGPAYGDGLPGLHARFYERIVPGSTKTVSITVNGVTTTLTGVTAGGSPAYGVDYDGQIQLSTTAYAVAPTTPFPGYSTYLVCTDDCTGTVPGASWERDWSGGGDMVEADLVSGFSLNIHSKAGTPPASTGNVYATAIRQVTGKIHYGLRGKYLALDGAALTEAKETALLQDSAGLVSLSGNSPSSDFEQWAYLAEADLNTTAQSVGPIDLRQAVRAHLLTFGLDDPKDWRLQFQLWPWSAFRVEQDASVQVAADKVLTQADSSIPL